jgi:hypothetical protein
MVRGVFLRLSETMSPRSRLYPRLARLSRVNPFCYGWQGHAPLRDPVEKSGNMVTQQHRVTMPPREVQWLRRKKVARLKKAVILNERSE